MPCGPTHLTKPMPNRVGLDPAGLTAVCTSCTGVTVAVLAVNQARTLYMPLDASRRSSSRSRSHWVTARGSEGCSTVTENH